MPYLVAAVHTYVVVPHATGGKRSESNTNMTNRSPDHRPIEQVDALRTLLDDRRAQTVEYGRHAFAKEDPAEARRLADRLERLNEAEAALDKIAEALSGFPPLPNASTREVRNTSVIAPERLGEPVTLTFQGLTAKGAWNGKVFTLFAGSEFRDAEVPSTPDHIRDARRDLKRNGGALREGDHWRVMRDVQLHSPSLAAGIVLGRSANGRKEWRRAGGGPLGDPTPKG